MWGRILGPVNSFAIYAADRSGCPQNSPDTPAVA
jgi:hypothetical protein